MSLAKQIAARMLAKKTPAAAPAEKSTPPRVVSPPARHKSPEPKTPPVPMAERRQRISEGHLRRNAPPPPAATPPPIVPVAVPTSAQPAERRRVDPWPKPPPARPIDPPISVFREMSDEEALACGVLPDGELLDDWKDAGVHVHGEALPPPRPTPAPPERAIVAAAAAAPEKAAAAAALEEKRASIEASAKWKSQCKAIDARTGLRCGLMHGHTVDHRHARGAFVTVAQGRLVARPVDAAAWNTIT